MEAWKKKIEIERKIRILKKKLADTDYQAIKYAEGELSAEEYAETKEKRKEWRVEINRLQAELSELSQTEVQSATDD